MVLLEASILVGGITLIAFFSWFFTCVDCDLSLTFTENYGKPISCLKGHVAWIIGCASGIGEALAYDLCSNGVKLVLSDIKGEELKLVKKNCLDKFKNVSPDDILLLPLDITDHASFQPSLELAVKHFGQIDLVFSNAGCTQRADFIDITSEVDRSLFNVNVFGHVAFARVMLKHFLEKGKGHFVITSSMLGKCAFPRAATYVASKFALLGFFETLRVEYYNKNINVTLVCPAHVFSNLYDNCYTSVQGKFYTEGMKDTDNRMTAQRCAHLMAVAAANKMEEIWPACQPSLCGLYLCQYAPTLFRRFIASRFSVSADAIRDGRKMF